MDLVTFFSQTHNLPYTGAAVIMLSLFVLEIAALVVGVSLTGSHDTHWDHDAAGDGLLDWLGAGAVPMLVFLVVLLTNFALSGWIINFIAWHVLGNTLPMLLTVPFATIAALPGTRGINRTLARIMPNSESNAVKLEDLVGRTAQISIGTATTLVPTMARCLDAHNTQHVIMVYSDDPDHDLVAGQAVRLDRISNGRFHATAIRTRETN